MSARYEAHFRAANEAMRAHGLELVENMPDGDCVLHSLIDHYPDALHIDALRRHLVDSMLTHFRDDVEHDRRNGAERSVDAWARHLREPRTYLPPELAVRVFGELDAPELSVRLWAVPCERDADAPAAAAHGPCVLYSNERAPTDTRRRCDVELVLVQAIRHVVAARPCAPRIVFKNRELFAGLPRKRPMMLLRVYERAPSVAPTPLDDASLRAETSAFSEALEAYYRRTLVPVPLEPDDEPVRRKSRR